VENGIALAWSIFDRDPDTSGSSSTMRMVYDDRHPLLAARAARNYVGMQVKVCRPQHVLGPGLGIPVIGVISC